MSSPPTPRELLTIVEDIHQVTGYPTEYLTTCRRPDHTIIRHSGLPAARWHIWRQAHANGVTIETIATTYGVTTRWVTTILTRRSVDAPDP